MSILSFTKKMVGGSKAKTPTKKRSEATERTTSSDTKVAVASAAGRIGLQPLITEKAVNAGGNANIVAFRVRQGVSKGQVRAAVVARYHVNPVAVRSVTVSAKTRVRGRTSGRTNQWKKMYVTLPAGKTLDFGV